MYVNGTGVARDDAQAATFARKACDSGYSRGCFNLGWMYENGRGVGKDVKQAEELYHTACEADIEEGCKNLKRLKP
jgi:TPR repeat protein